MGISYVKPTVYVVLRGACSICQQKAEILGVYSDWDDAFSEAEDYKLSLDVSCSHIDIHEVEMDVRS